MKDYELTWREKRVLVTGAGGFIGSHLAERLAGLGARTRAFLHYNSSGSRGWLERSPFFESLEFVAGDIRDSGSVRSAMEGVDTVFHLAALIGIPYSYIAPASYIETNVIGTLNVLQSAREMGAACVVHTSTSEVYGTARYAPIDEAHSLQGQSPYSASKIGADKLAESYHLSFGLPVVTVRPFNTFGPRQSARAVIPTIISQCLSGNTVRLGSLHPTRDLNYVQNTVDGFLAAASSPEAIGRTINIGSGREITIGELARMIAGLVEKEIDIESDDERVRPVRSEVGRLIAGNSLAQEILGWRPKVSLEEGLTHTIDWMRENLGRYRVGQYAV